MTRRSFTFTNSINYYATGAVRVNGIHTLSCISSNASMSSFDAGNSQGARRQRPIHSPAPIHRYTGTPVRPRTPSGVTAYRHILMAYRRIGVTAHRRKKPRTDTPVHRSGRGRIGVKWCFGAYYPWDQYIRYTDTRVRPPGRAYWRIDVFPSRAAPYRRIGISAYWRTGHPRSP